MNPYSLSKNSWADSTNPCCCRRIHVRIQRIHGAVKESIGGFNESIHTINESQYGFDESMLIVEESGQGGRQTRCCLMNAAIAMTFETAGSKIFSILFYSHGILTRLVYSVQASPNISDNFFSSSGALLLNMMNRMIPSTRPNHVSSINPTHGTTNKHTPVYKGCFTMENGPDVINLCFGTLIRINICDQIQLIRPMISTMVETINNQEGGPPTKNVAGDKMFIRMATSIIGKINLAVLLPIPINSLMFISTCIEKYRPGFTVQRRREFSASLLRIYLFIASRKSRRRL